MRRHGLGLIVGVLAAGLAPREAHASSDFPTLEPLGQAIAEALNNLNFYSQVQVGVGAVFSRDTPPGGTELRAVVSGAGLGGSLGGRYEPRPHGGGSGLGFVDLELRPLPALGSNVYRVIDPFVSVGGELGGGSLGLRAAQTLGAGLDIGLLARPHARGESLHPAIGLRYQLRTVQTPSDQPAHLFHIGAAFRVTF